MRYLLVIIATVILSTSLFANDFTKLYIKFKVTSEVDMAYVKSIVKVYKIENNYAYAVCDEPGFYKFKALHYEFREIPNPIVATKALTMATTVAEMSNWNRYPTHDVYKQMMQDFAINYPSIASLDTIGFSNEGRPILVLKISDNVNTDEDEPEFFYTGQMHGNEIVAYIMFLRLIDEMLTNYGTDPQITNLINNVEIYINPLSNPDGTYAGGDNTVSGATRTNANNVDLNRDYPCPSNSEGNPINQSSSSWATETADMIQYVTERDFVMSANSHSGSEVVNYPWDMWTTAENAHADNDWWIYVSHIYADLAQSNGSAINYFTGVTSSGITEGKEWYPAYGSRQDYMNYYQNCRETTLELSTAQGNLDAAALPNYWNYNRQAMLDYIDEVLYGVRGIVTSECDGTPIKAKVEIVGHDHDNSFVYSSLPVGNYHRPIKAGTYDITFSAPNYITKTITNVTVTDGDITYLNVQLDADVASIDFSSDIISTCDGNVEFTSPDGLSNISWDFGDGEQSSEANPIHQYSANGTYSVKMRYEMCSSLDSITKINYIVVDMLPSPLVNDEERCNVGALTLTATSSSNGTLYWYDNQNNFLQTGTSYTTPNLSATTQYYVQEADVMMTDNVGLVDNSAGGNYYNDETRYLIFDVYTDLTLKSVKVYSNSYAVRTFVLKDGSGNTIYQTNKNFGAGEQVITLNWNIPAGNNYQIKIDSSDPDLWRNNVGVSYPYTIPEVMSITNSSEGNDFYYFFYNWEVKYSSSCRSEMAEINAIINPLPTSNFSFNQNYNNIYFSNVSQNATSYLWDFDDSNSSTDVNPIHTYSTVGDFTVSLTATNSCGDNITSDTVHITVVNIDELLTEQIKIYPNPAKEFINIVSKNKINFISIKSIDGKEIISEIDVNIIDVSTLKKGVYLLVINTNNKNIIKRIVIE